VNAAGPSLSCRHVPDELAAWYAAHPAVVCARCWLEGKGGPIRKENRPGNAALTAPTHRRPQAADTPRNVGGAA